MADTQLDPAYLKTILADAAKTYIAANAGPWTAEVEAYVSGFVDAQVAALAAHNVKITQA